MYHDLREIYWWKGLKRDWAEFAAKCPNCKQLKVEHQKFGGLLRDIKIPTFKWGDLNMDFVVGLPHYKKSYDSISMVVDTWSKCAYFIPFKCNHSTEDYPRIFLD